MTKTTNKAQESYMIAKAYLETLEGMKKDIERKYIADHNIVNSDGSTPDQIYCIDDEAVFDVANLECSELPESKSNWQDILVAREALKIAEAKLIGYGLSIAPAREREVLTKAVKENYTTRLKVINLVLKLDVSTVR